MKNVERLAEIRAELRAIASKLVAADAPGADAPNISPLELRRAGFFILGALDCAEDPSGVVYSRSLAWLNEDAGDPRPT